MREELDEWRTNAGDPILMVEQERANRAEVEAERDALRAALVKWKRRQPITTWEYIEAVLDLIPDDEWGIEL